MPKIKFIVHWRGASFPHVFSSSLLSFNMNKIINFRSPVSQVSSEISSMQATVGKSTDLPKSGPDKK